MTSSLLISYLGDNRPGLVSQFLAHMKNLGGNIDDITFASLGRKAEMTFIYKDNDDLDCDQLRADLNGLPAVSNSNITIQPYTLNTEQGPSHRITHRIVLTGYDEPGLISNIISTLDEYGAIIVRMNAESINGSAGNQCIARFAVSMRDERAPDCLSAVVRKAGEMKLTFRYETA